MDNESLNRVAVGAVFNRQAVGAAGGGRAIKLDQRVAGIAGLSCRVQGDRFRDCGQGCRSHNNGLQPATANIERDGVGPGVGIGIEDRLAERTRTAVVGIGDDKRGQQAGPVLLHIGTKGQAGLDQALVVLQVPVAAQRGVAGIVKAGGRIDIGQCRQRLQQHATFFARGQIATVDQQVRTVAQRVPPTRDLPGVRADVVHGQPGGTQLQRSIGAMGNQVNRIQILVVDEGGSDLIDAVAIGLQQDHIDSSTLCL